MTTASIACSNTVGSAAFCRLSGIVFADAPVSGVFVVVVVDPVPEGVSGAVDETVSGIADVNESVPPGGSAAEDVSESFVVRCFSATCVLALAFVAFSVAVEHSVLTQ